MELISFFIILSIVHTSQEEIGFKIVDTLNGKVRGRLENSQFNGKQYFAFKGIPYSRPPVGKWRFKVINFEW